MNFLFLVKNEEMFIFISKSFESGEELVTLLSLSITDLFYSAILKST